jgi:hypothetical protein
MRQSTESTHRITGSCKKYAPVQAPLPPDKIAQTCIIGDPGIRLQIEYSSKHVNVQATV